MRSLKDALDDLLRGSRELGRVQDEVRVLKAWNALNDERLLSNLNFEKFVGGTLSLSARNAAWAQQAQMMKPRIIAGVNSALGEPAVKDVRLIGGAFRNEPRSSKGRTPMVCPSCGTEHVAEGERCPICSRIDRERTRLKLIRLFDKDPKVSLRQAMSEIPGVTELEFKRAKRDMKEHLINEELIERRSRGRKKSS